MAVQVKRTLLNRVNPNARWRLGVSNDLNGATAVERLERFEQMF
jgi:hypothetical protein